MFTKALYYPHIMLPDDIWLRRSLLYWDTINPIVPTAVKIPEKHVMWELKSQGVLDFIRPEDHVDHIDFSEFLWKVHSAQNGIDYPHEGYSVLIHAEKFEADLLQDLEDAHLCWTEPGNSEWIRIGVKTGILYLGTLAAGIARYLNLEPITKTEDFHHILLTSQTLSHVSHGQQTVEVQSKGVEIVSGSEYPFC